MTKITKTEFIKLSSKKLSDSNAEDKLWLDKYFVAYLSPTVAYWLSLLNISANAATFTFFGLAILANIILLIPVWWTPIITLVLYVIVRVLDEVDGRLARYQRTQSKFGETLDIFSELLAHSTFILMLGIRLYMETGIVWLLILGGVGVLPYLYEGLWVKFSNELVGPFEYNHPTTFSSRIRSIYVNCDYILFSVLSVAVLYFLQSLFNLPYLVFLFFIIHIISGFFIKVVLRFVFVVMQISKGNLVGVKLIPREKIYPLPDLVEILKNERKQKKVVFSSGVFDLFHYGHFLALKKASKLGDIFIVQIDGNELVQSRKGENRPLIGENLRAEIISSLEFVNYVFISNSPSESIEVFKCIQPDIFVRALKGEETNDNRKKREDYLKKISPKSSIFWLEQAPEISTTKISSVTGNNLLKYQYEQN